MVFCSSWGLIEPFTTSKIEFWCVSLCPIPVRGVFLSMIVIRLGELAVYFLNLLPLGTVSIALITDALEQKTYRCLDKVRSTVSD